MRVFTLRPAVVVPVNDKSVNVISALLVVPSSKSVIFLILAKSVIVTVAPFRCVLAKPEVRAPCRETLCIYVRAVDVRVHLIYSLLDTLPQSIVRKYVPVGSATLSSSVALSRVAVVAPTATLRLRVVLKSAITFQIVVPAIYLL